MGKTATCLRRWLIASEAKLVDKCAAGGRVLAHSTLFRHRSPPEMFPGSAKELTSRACSPKIELSGPVAQLGARFHGMEEVIGSIPIRSTKQPLQINSLPKLSSSLLGAVGSKFKKLFEKQLQKSVCFPLSSALRRKFSLQLFFLSTSSTPRLSAPLSIPALPEVPTSTSVRYGWSSPLAARFRVISCM
jgi:hypothetical protein